jgi:predicted N-acyltransferase
VPEASFRVLKQIREVPAAQWDALLTPGAQPFLSFDFLDSLEASGSAGGESGWEPRHLTLWRDGQLVAAAPAYAKHHSFGEFVYDFSWAEAAARIGYPYYPKLVLGVPVTPASGPRLLIKPGEPAEALKRQLVKAALTLAEDEGLSSIHALYLDAEDAAVFESAGLAIRHTIQYHWRNAGYASYDDFLARFTSKRRAQLKRERREVKTSGISIATRTGDALKGADPDELYRLYCTTVDKHVWGRRMLAPPLFEQLLTRFRHRLEVVEAREGGKLIAGAINFSGPRVLYGRYWGAFEERPFLHFEVCLYHPVEEAIARGLDRFEPGAGGEHKLSRGFEPQVTYSAHRIFHPELDRAVRRFLLQEQAAIAEGIPSWRLELGFKNP